MDSIQPELKLILLSVKINASTDDLQQIKKLAQLVNDWDIVSKIAINTGLAPLLYQKIKLLEQEISIPAETFRKLKKAYYTTLSRSIHLQKAYIEIGKLFNENNIEFIPLKGIYLCEWLYKDPGLRLMSDIDLLVKVEDGPRCIRLLHEMGYVYPNWDLEENAISMKDLDLNSGPIHYRQVLKEDVSIEIHIKLQYEAENCNFKLEQIRENTILTNNLNFRYYRLEFYDLLIYQCLHLKKHFLGLVHVQFSGFADIANILNEYEYTIDWDILESRCLRYNCNDIVYSVLAIVYYYFEAPLPFEKKKKYAYYLSNYDKKLFILYLRGHKIKFNEGTIPVHIRN